MECRERLEQYFREHQVPFEVLSHSEAYTMQEVAASLHIPGKQVAKVVIVKADGKMAMLVVSSPDLLNFAKVGALLDAKNVRLAKEDEFGDLFPDCEVGGMPPFGNLYGIPVFVDQTLSNETDIVFRVGTLQEVMKITYADFARLAQPTVGEFATQV
jgi:Ala-tRNA(Pro) deacylase